MNLDDIRIFTKVVEAGSFTKAAALLAIPKSTVSRRVSELEERLAVRLIQRTTRKLHLTDAGSLYFNQTARLLDDLNEAEAALSQLQAEPRGVLRVTTPPTLSSTLPTLFAEFQTAYPQVDVAVFGTGRRVDLVAEGYDLALRAGRLADSSLISKLLSRSHLALFASPEYLRKHGNPRRPEELLNHHCIIFSNDQFQDNWLLYGPLGATSVAVRGRFASRDVALNRGATLRGQGIALLPHFVGMPHEERGEMVRVLPDFKGEENNLYAVYPSARHLSPKVRAFIDFTQQWIAGHKLSV